ncbi:peptide chain release factor 2 [Myxococcota bacterium]|nr:peptide chain release factor 2 [Myxococcota bacterium]
MFENLKQRIADLRERTSVLGRSLDPDGLRRRLQALEEESARPEFWQDPRRAREVGRERNRIEKDLAEFEAPLGALNAAADLLELAEAEGEASMEAEIARELDEVERQVARLEFARMMNGENDRADALVTINAGMGGTESQDWVTMLLRMYLRWAERRGFATEILDELPGEEAGLKHVTFEVSGEWAYGYLKAEAGVHRLVRISPFDANARRQTTFAGVSVLPDIEDTIEIEIDEKDLRVDTYRSGGAGGQHVNKTDSAVRITHLPTGIVVQCQNERSQQKNRSKAMKMLKARLYDLERQKKEAERGKAEAEKRDIDFGSQIRSYVLHPYRMVKDLRTGYETGNADAVLDGDLDPFIETFLLKASR